MLSLPTWTRSKTPTRTTHHQCIIVPKTVNPVVYHRPKNLAMSIAIEAVELMEHF